MLEAMHACEPHAYVPNVKRQADRTPNTTHPQLSSRISWTHVPIVALRVVACSVEGGWSYRSAKKWGQPTHGRNERVETYTTQSLDLRASNISERSSRWSRPWMCWFRGCCESGERPFASRSITLGESWRKGRSWNCFFFFFCFTILALFLFMICKTLRTKMCWYSGAIG